MGFFISTIEHTSRAQNSYLINSVGPGFASHPSSISLFITRFASVGSTSNQPEVHIETHDGLELETQVGYKPDGSIVVHIHKRRPASAGRNAPSGAMLPPCKLESIILPPPISCCQPTCEIASALRIRLIASSRRCALTVLLVLFYAESYVSGISEPPQKQESWTLCTHQHHLLLMRMRFRGRHHLINLRSCVWKYTCLTSPVQVISRAFHPT